MTNKKIVIVFDLDDTLYKEERFVESGIRVVASIFCRQRPDAIEIMLAARRRHENFFDAIAAAIPDFPTKAALLFYRIHVADITLSDGCRKVLSTLHELGVPMYIITDGRKNTQYVKYRSLELDEYIPRKRLIISEETGHDKNDPDNFMQVMRENPDAEQFVYIGDNPQKDFLHPNALGWTTIQLNDVTGENIHPQQGDFSPEHYAKTSIDDITEILDILQ